MANKVADIIGTLNRMVTGDIEKIRAEQESAYRGVELSMKKQDSDRAHDLALKQMAMQEDDRFKKNTAELGAMVTASQLKLANSLSGKFTTALIDPIFLNKDGSYDFSTKNLGKLSKQLKNAGIANSETMARNLVIQAQGGMDSDGNSVATASDEVTIELAQTIASTLAQNPEFVNNFIDAGIFPEGDTEWAEFTKGLNQLLTLRDTGLQLQEELMGIAYGDTEYDKDYRGVFWDLGLQDNPAGRKMGTATEGMAGTEGSSEFVSSEARPGPDEDSYGKYPQEMKYDKNGNPYIEDKYDYGSLDLKWQIQEASRKYGRNTPKGKAAINKILQNNSQYLVNDYEFLSLNHGFEEGDDIHTMEKNSRKNLQKAIENKDKTQATIDSLYKKLGRTNTGRSYGDQKLSKSELLKVEKQIAANVAMLGQYLDDYNNHKVQYSAIKSDSESGDNKRLRDYFSGEYAFNFLGFETLRTSGVMDAVPGTGAPANPLRTVLQAGNQLFSPKAWREQNIPAIKSVLKKLDTDGDNKFTVDLSDVPGALIDWGLEGQSEVDQNQLDFYKMEMDSMVGSIPKDWSDTRRENRGIAADFYETEKDKELNPIKYFESRVPDDIDLPNLDFLYPNENN